MLGQAQSPLVSDANNSRAPAVRWLITLLGGLLFGSGAIMIGAAVLGSLLGVGNVAWTGRLYILLAAICVFMLFDIPAASRGGVSRLGLSRQTPKVLRHRLRDSDLTAFLWGADIGTGVSTFRVTSAIWLGLLAVLLGLVPVYVGWLYGVGLTLALAFLTVVTGGGSALLRNLPRLVAMRRPVQLTYVVSVATVGLVTSYSIVAP